MPRPTTATSAVPHEGQHVPDRAIHAHQDRPGDDGVPDVQLVDLLDAGDGLHVVVVEPVPGGDPEAELAPGPGRVDDPGQLAGALLGVRGLAVAAGVQLDPVRPELVGGAHGVEVRVDEERDDDVAVLEVPDRLGQRFALAGNVEATFGGELL